MMRERRTANVMFPVRMIESVIHERFAAFIVLLGVTIVVFAGPSVARRGPVIKIQQYGPVQPWTDKDLHNDPMRFQFAIVTDRTGGHRAGVFKDAVTRLNLLQPEFVMSVGDLIEGYTEDKRELARQWDEFDGMVNALDTRFFYIPGNHDVSNGTMGKFWEKRYGPLHYFFLYGDVLFLCLNSQDPPIHHMGDEQIAWARGVLNRHRKVRWTLVFLHTPLWNQDPEKNGWAKMERVLQGRPYTVFAGHYHTYKKDVRHDRRYFTLATTGGGSQLRGRKFGEFDHVVWVTMTNQGPIVANLLLQGILDEDLTEDMGSILKRIAAGRMVKLNSALLSDPGVRTFDVRVRITNDEEVPFTVRLTWKKHDQFRLEPMEITKVVPPNSVETIDWKMSSDTPVKVEEFAPAVLEYQGKYEFPGLAPIDVESKLAFGIDTLHQCPKLRRSPVVDGDLRDWKTFPFDVVNPKEVGMVPSTWKGVKDAKFRFATGYDKKFVYVAVDAIDDAATAKDRTFWQSDAVIISIYPHDPRGDQPALETMKASHIVYGQTPEGQMPDYYEETLPEGAQWACVRSKTGWTAELAIPRSVMSPDAFRLNVGQIDTDGDEEWGTVLYWRPGGPGADSVNSYPESGIFLLK